ncbi:GTPase Era [Flavobacteriaceae bacterium]|jgi:GTP-binding protein Era|nr:GTPase Era [Flavobacteriaceae bacterium]|tara:strand:- start:401 stop:1282 length:882 start_codon:yes stop_codon:yes gene_type:complete
MHKSGFINIIGNPNVGKSTLTNALVGRKLSIITSKAQTTRHRILALINDEDYQLVISDTPGIIKPAHKLHESMMDFVNMTLEDADVLIYMVEYRDYKLKDARLFNKIKNTKTPLILIINKIDSIDQPKLESEIDHWKVELPNAEIWPISAKEMFNIDGLLKRILEIVPEGPAYFPKDQLTDKPERFFVNEIIREKILLNYKKEIPYSVEVETESFVEELYIIKIRSIIMVERSSQKGIIIGHKGEAIKAVGTKARIDMEVFFDKKIFLDLQVKVNKNWRSSEKQLKRFGYNQK